jgi:radical SAM protein with 4Fe4S-binding SPASM domain
MRLADYKALFQSMPLGREEVNVVGGGEPLIHPEAVEIMREIKRHRLKGSLITNGTLMNEPVSKALIDARWNLVRVSVNAGDAETYRIAQGVDRFDTLVDNLKTFVRLRREAGAEFQCRLTILHIIQRENLATIDKLFSLAEEVGADSLEFDPVIPYSPHFELSPDELRQAHDVLIACARDSHLPSNIAVALPQLQAEETFVRENKPFSPGKWCSAGFDQTFITSIGDVYPCCFSDEKMGNVREQAFRNIWFSQKYADFRRRLIRGIFPHYCIANRCPLPRLLHG